MRPYYEDSHTGIVIYNADCRDVLPALESGSVDLVLTDPPYVVAAPVQLRGNGVAPPRRDSTTIGNQGWTYSKSWLSEAARVCQKHIVAFCGFKDMGELLVEQGQGELRGIFTWRKSNAALPAWNVPHYDTEFAVWWGRGVNPSNVRRIRSMVLDRPFPQAGCFAVERLVDAGGKALHPSQKPLSVVLPLVDAFSTPGEMVLDPFAGSGTTILAAKMLGRRCAAIEINEFYCEMAARRLSQEILPLEATNA